MAAIKVPDAAGSFKEPITVTAGNCGKSTSAAGTCINPPPPDMASVKPARKAARQSSKMISQLILIFVQYAQELVPGAHFLLVLLFEETNLSLSEVGDHQPGYNGYSTYDMYTGDFFVQQQHRFNTC